jgi:CubicO group peptidase (beta-lactamase class C family)
MNRPETRMMSLPGFGGIATARGLAKFYDALLRAPFLDWMTGRLTSGHDRVLQVETAFSAGFMLDPLDVTGRKLRTTFGPSPRAFGHAGAGGSLAFADPERGLSFAYVMNQMEQGVLPGPKAAALVAALDRLEARDARPAIREETQDKPHREVHPPVGPTDLQRA